MARNGSGVQSRSGDHSPRPSLSEDQSTSSAHRIGSGDPFLGGVQNEKQAAAIEDGPLPRLFHKKRNELVEGRLITEADCPEKFAHNFSPSKKIWILFVVSVLQISMNLNASIMGSAYGNLAERFSLSEIQLRLCTALFLIAYGFG